MEPDPKLTDKQLQLTMFSLLERYTGPAALPIPPELAEWVETAQLWAEVLDLHLRNNIKESQQTLARLENLRKQ